MILNKYNMCHQSDRMVVSAQISCCPLGTESTTILLKKQCRLPLTIHIVRTTFHLVNQDFKSAQWHVSIRVDISPQLCILHQCPTSSTQPHNDPSVSSIPQASSVDLSKQQMLRLHEHRAAQTYICSHLCWFRKKGEIIKYRTKRT